MSVTVVILYTVSDLQVGALLPVEYSEFATAVAV